MVWKLPRKNAEGQSGAPAKNRNYRSLSKGVLNQILVDKMKSTYQQDFMGVPQGKFYIQISSLTVTQFFLIHSLILYYLSFWFTEKQRCSFKGNCKTVIPVYFKDGDAFAIRLIFIVFSLLLNLIAYQHYSATNNSRTIINFVNLLTLSLHYAAKTIFSKVFYLTRLKKMFYVLSLEMLDSYPP